MRRVMVKVHTQNLSLSLRAQQTDWGVWWQFEYWWLFLLSPILCPHISMWRIAWRGSSFKQTCYICRVSKESGCRRGVKSKGMLVWDWCFSDNMIGSEALVIPTIHTFIFSGVCGLEADPTRSPLSLVFLPSYRHGVGCVICKIFNSSWLFVRKVHPTNPEYAANKTSMQNRLKSH